MISYKSDEVRKTGEGHTADEPLSAVNWAPRRARKALRPRRLC